MIFTLNGGPGDGQKVEVGGKHDDGRTVRFVLIHEGTTHVYICPSEDDFVTRQLFLTRLPLEYSVVQPSASSWSKKQVEGVWGNDIADWLSEPNSPAWNDWKTSVHKAKKLVKTKKPLAKDKKAYSTTKDWHNKGHEA